MAQKHEPVLEPIPDEWAVVDPGFSDQGQQRPFVGDGLQHRLVLLSHALYGALLDAVEGALKELVQTWRVTQVESSRARHVPRGRAGFERQRGQVGAAWPARTLHRPVPFLAPRPSPPPRTPQSRSLHPPVEARLRPPPRERLSGAPQGRPSVP